MPPRARPGSLLEGCVAALRAAVERAAPDPRQPASEARSFAARYAAQQGCGDGRVDGLDGADDAKFKVNVFVQLRGSCVDAESGAVRGFESTIRCDVKPVGGALWVEGSSEQITVSTGCGIADFRFVDET